MNRINDAVTCTKGCTLYKYKSFSCISPTGRHTGLCRAKLILLASRQNCLTVPPDLGTCGKSRTHCAVWRFTVSAGLGQVRSPYVLLEFLSSRGLYVGASYLDLLLIPHRQPTGRLANTVSVSEEAPRVQRGVRQIVKSPWF